MICGRLRGIDELEAGYTVALCSVADTEIDKAQKRAEGNAEYCTAGFFFIGTYASVECEQPYFLTTDDLNIIFTANILSSAQSNDACPPYF